MKVDYFEVTLDRSIDEPYLGGDPIKGIIEMVCSKQVRINGLIVRLTGIAETGWRNRQDDLPYESRHTFMDERIDLTTTIADHCNNDFELQEGKHCIEFEGKVPLDVLSSVERENHGSIRYTCTALMAIPEDGDTEVVSEKTFKVYSLLNLDAPYLHDKSHVTEEEEITGCCGRRKGTITATMQIEEIGVMPGRASKIILTVENKTRKRKRWIRQRDNHECVLLSLCQQLDFVAVNRHDPMLVDRKSLTIAVESHGTCKTKAGADVIVFKPNDEVDVLKVLSVDPANYPDAPTEAMRQVLERETGRSIPRGAPLPTELISWIRMGTTVATNALLERKGERIGLLITKGFKDLLFIGNQSRPNIFQFDIRIPDVLYEDVIEVNERVLIFDQAKELITDLNKVKSAINGCQVFVEQELDEAELENSLKTLKQRDIKSVAILFIHSFIYPYHEKKAGQIAKNCGLEYISLSHQVMPMIKVVPRGFTVCADAYLTPKIMDYIRGFRSGFDNLSNLRVDFMQSDGGLCDMNTFRGSRAILSGPAGGVVGIANTAYYESDGKPVIGFDMGGTSTDVCRFSGHLEHVMETTTAGITIQAPQLDIRTVAAGGGSRLFFRDGLLVVGPESAGAHPGPVCYRKKGFLTVTDANVVLGRILPDFFPKIFGPNSDQELDSKASYTAMAKIAEEVNAFMKEKNNSTYKQFTVEEVALGFIAVANEEMCRPIRTLTESRGYNPSDHILACFGGAGGQHACAVAKNLGISQVRIHKYSALLSAYGIALADVVNESQRPAQLVYNTDNYSLIRAQFVTMKEESCARLYEQGFSDDRMDHTFFMNMQNGNIELEIGHEADKNESVEADPIRLAIFSNRFMSIAEQMGRVLQRTAISTNIKERLDFSCALFAPDGGLIANAPHIPVHLGGMQYSVKFQIEHRGIENIKDGDVFLANHPKAGGCHLPDFTVITPVFFKSVQNPVFFVANRGHHADIGGLVPGSMPPNSRDINQEGAAFVSFKLVDDGVFQEQELIKALQAPGDVLGCSPARNISDNIADLNAQIAANRKGIELVTSLIEEYSLEVVHAYMQHIQNTAELCVREMLRKVARDILKTKRSCRLEGEDFMDDGTIIKLTVDANPETGSAVFDFTGTGPESFTSCNAPRAVTMSAITYCLRYPEILESRFPVILREWRLREGSGGQGMFHGGDGVVRSLEFTKPLTISLLTERRAFQPYGLRGGSCGKRGLNLLRRKNRTVNIGSKATFEVCIGDVLSIATPGGGGYGSPNGE
ncbi:unnamed protein product [Caenorhabditis sp. 36 PRJEB53466]|nr:unnamed protein product [Caenorhabditis sp. 36 PRJEB53466]